MKVKRKRTMDVTRTIESLGQWVTEVITGDHMVGKYHMTDKYLKRSKSKKWGSFCNIIPRLGTKPTRLCLLTTLVDVLFYIVVHIFIFLCLDSTSMAAYEAAATMTVAPLALLVLGAV